MHTGLPISLEDNVICDLEETEPSMIDLLLPLQPVAFLSAALALKNKQSV